MSSKKFKVHSLKSQEMRQGEQRIQNVCSAEHLQCAGLRLNSESACRSVTWSCARLQMLDLSQATIAEHLQIALQPGASAALLKSPVSSVLFDDVAEWKTECMKYFKRYILRQSSPGDEARCSNVIWSMLLPCCV